MLSLFLATVAFFVSTYYVKRYLDATGIEKGFVRGALIFTIALAISCVVAFAVDRLSPQEKVERRTAEVESSEAKGAGKGESPKPEGEGGKPPVISE